VYCWHSSTYSCVLLAQHLQSGATPIRVVQYQRVLIGFHLRLEEFHLRLRLEALMYPLTPRTLTKHSATRAVHPITLPCHCKALMTTCNLIECAAVALMPASMHQQSMHQQPHHQTQPLALIVWVPTRNQSLAATVTIRVDNVTGGSGCFTLHNMTGGLVQQRVCAGGGALIVPNAGALPFFLLPS
jgi:hypothetical protein